jgi:hypothetical protein
MLLLLLLFVLRQLPLLVLFFIFLATLVSHACSFSAVVTRSLESSEVHGSNGRPNNANAADRGVLSAAVQLSSRLSTAIPVIFVIVKTPLGQRSR